MGYQALLFSPDEKLARVVSQVFTELDFSVEPAPEPFDAVKRMMAQHYDAVVVDCEDEQNASLLFKSARNSSLNHSSLAIALVEGQAGVAKAYRIGANLVLTKPINVEQAKGTLRVARGLLRKNSDVAGSSAGSGPVSTLPMVTAPVPAAGSSQPASRGATGIPPGPELPEFDSPLPATVPEALPTGLPAGYPAAFLATSAPAKFEDRPAVPAPATQTTTTMAAEPAVPARQSASTGIIRNDSGHNDVVKGEAARIPAATPVQTTSSAFTSPGPAAAPAPAKRVAAPPSTENKAVGSEPAKPSPYKPSKTAPILSSVPDVPSFAILGAEPAEDSHGSGGQKKTLIAAGIVLALAALGYLGYGKLGKSSTATPASQSVVGTSQDSAKQDSGQPAPAPAPAPKSSPIVAPSPDTPTRASSTTQFSAPKTAAATSPDLPSPGPLNPPAIRIALNPGPAATGPATKRPDPAPLLVKSNPVGTRSQDSGTPLPIPPSIASANDSALTGLLASSSSLPKPALATARISQGVSQGLLIKRVQPKYPQAALAVHAQGAVQIEAIITKEGNVTNLRVLSGDPVLARAALDAVRQWRYKPYYLDGEPVEIETQITVNFKAN